MQFPATNFFRLTFENRQGKIEPVMKLKGIFKLLAFGFLLLLGCGYFKRLTENILPEESILYGWVKDAEYQEALKEAKVRVGEQSVLTNAQGYFILNKVPIGLQLLEISKEGYQPYQKRVKVVKDKLNNIGEVYLLRRKTEVNGKLTGDNLWKEANSPYVVTSDLLVEGQLRVEAGVKIEVAKGVKIRVTGVLILDGSPEKKIEISSHRKLPDKGDWQGIFIEEAGSVNFKYTIISFAQYGLSVYRGKEVSISYCEFHHNSRSGIEITASPLVLKNNKFHHNNQHGAHLKSWTGEFLEIKGNEFFDNRQSGIFIQSAKSKIIRNTFKDNTGHGIWYQYFLPLEKGIIKQCNIINNGNYAICGNGDNKPPLDLIAEECYITNNYSQRYTVTKEGNYFSLTQCEDGIWVKRPRQEMIDISQ
jgi:parallel beta-helix repeat protein